MKGFSSTLLWFLVFGVIVGGPFSFSQTFSAEENLEEDVTKLEVTLPQHRRKSGVKIAKELTETSYSPKPYFYSVLTTPAHTAPIYVINCCFRN